MALPCRKAPGNGGPQALQEKQPDSARILHDGRQGFRRRKQRQIDHFTKTQQLSEAWFDGRESHSFGPLTKNEWNTMFYKHLDHHLTQFGV
jgi:hypothetical protein